MKAISLWQPSASLVSMGGKLIETRSWYTPYRGPLAICATKNTPAWYFDASLSESEIHKFFHQQGVYYPRRDLPRGCVVAVANLVDCVPITQEFAASLSPLEWAAGNYEPGRYAWMLENVVELRTPLPVTGGQKFFEVSGVCRLCGCTDTNCAGCIERTGVPCSWVESDLCSACAKPTIQRVHQVLSNHRFDVSEEKPLQEQIAEVLMRNNIDFNREVNLSPHDRIDFLVGDLGIEVKIKGAPSEIFQQCRRYCANEQINELLLVTGRAMGFPGEIEGKPCYVVNLGRSWL
jgi:activating signal cointegrator 1